MAKFYWMAAASFCVAAWTIPDMYMWRFALRPRYRYVVGIVFSFCAGGMTGAWLGE